MAFMFRISPVYNTSSLRDIFNSIREVKIESQRCSRSLRRVIIFVRPFARGMSLGLQDSSLKLVIWWSHLFDGLSCLMLKYSFKMTKHHVCMCVFAWKNHFWIHLQHVLSLRRLREKRGFQRGGATSVRAISYTKTVSFFCKKQSFTKTLAVHSPTGVWTSRKSTSPSF